MILNQVLEAHGVLEIVANLVLILRAVIEVLKHLIDPASRLAVDSD